MKEYKVVHLKLGWKNRLHALEEILNQYAREGWIVKEMGHGWTSAILERDKNR